MIKLDTFNEYKNDLSLPEVFQSRENETRDGQTETTEKMSWFLSCNNMDRFNWENKDPSAATTFTSKIEMVSAQAPRVPISPILQLFVDREGSFLSRKAEA